MSDVKTAIVYQGPVCSVTRREPGTGADWHAFDPYTTIGVWDIRVPHCLDEHPGGAGCASYAVIGADKEWGDGGTDHLCLFSYVAMATGGDGLGLKLHPSFGVTPYLGMDVPALPEGTSPGVWAHALGRALARAITYGAITGLPDTDNARAGWGTMVSVLTADDGYTMGLYRGASAGF